MASRNMPGGSSCSFTRMRSAFSTTWRLVTIYPLGSTDLHVRGEEYQRQHAGADRDDAEGADAYKFMFIAKGGGLANKSFLFQATPSILTHERLLAFLKEKVLTLGTAACLLDHPESSSAGRRSN